MARQQTLSDKLRPLAGSTLVGLGLHILFGNLDRDASHFNHLLGAAMGEGLGLLPSIALATSQAAKYYAFDRHGFAFSLLAMLESFWPLLLVIAGAILLRDALADKVKTFPSPGKYFQNQDRGCRFRCPSFDA